jgi:hypothetical protein
LQFIVSGVDEKPVITRGTLLSGYTEKPVITRGTLLSGYTEKDYQLHSIENRSLQSILVYL